MGSSIPFVGALSLPSHFRWLFDYFCDPEYSSLSAVFGVWYSVLGLLCDSMVQSLWSPFLDTLGLPFLPFVWALLYLEFTCWWLLCWWILPSSGFTDIHNSHLVLYAVVQVLVNKAVLSDNQTYASKKNPPTTSAVSTSVELSWIKVKRTCQYYKIWQREKGKEKSRWGKRENK